MREKLPLLKRNESQKWIIALSGSFPIKSGGNGAEFIEYHRRYGGFAECTIRENQGLGTKLVFT